MIITCEACATRFVLDDDLIQPGGSKVRCSNCRHVFTAFPAAPPEIEFLDGPRPEEQDIPFDEPEIQDDPDFSESQNGDFNIADGPDTQDADLEDADIDFSDIEFDEPEFEQNPPEPQTSIAVPDAQGQDVDEDGLEFETVEFEINEPDLELHEDGLEPQLDFQDDSLELETLDFEFEEIEDEPSLVTPSASDDTDLDTADIEISLAQDDDPDPEPDLELEEFSFDIDAPVVEEPSIDALELDTKADELTELEFDDDPQADFIIEDDHLDLSLESEDDLIDPPPAQLKEKIIEAQPDINHDGLSLNEFKLEPDDSEYPDGREGDGEIEQIVPEEDKFAEYDKVLEQETEPEEIGITIPDPEVEDNADPSAFAQPPADDEIEIPQETSTDQAPLITPPSAHMISQKRGTKKKKGVSLPVKILLVLFLLILAGYVAIIQLGVPIPMVSGIQIPFITQWLEPKQTPQAPVPPVPDEPSIDGRFVSNKSAGDLFIVTGRIKNPSNTPVSYIQVKGSLMTKKNANAGTLIAYCGNIIPEETLKSGNISDITRQMGVREGNENTNVNIKPDASVMFMLVFSNLPEDMANFTVAVHGFEPVQK